MQGGRGPRGFVDVEAGRMRGSPAVHMAEESVRRAFVQKVYSLVAVQLVATAILATPIATAGEQWLQENSGLLLISTMAFLILAVSMGCCSHLLRLHPWNLLILACFTALEAISVGFYCAMYEMQSVLWCLAATGAVAGALTAVAFSGKVDVTGMGSYLRATSLALFVIGLGGLMFGAPLMQLAYAAGSVVLFAGYLVYDTQLVVGGKHQEKRFNIDDYVLAALSIYMDLVRLFLFLLRLMGERRSRR
mmetsp:Transcript_41883/g.91354  ORF Transcript_41883/g.91354 Transcript_41883/m.91354 type:complete len:248 (+) Transcript_41883:84-827(+)